MSELAFLSAWQPVKPVASNDFSRGAYPTWRGKALKMRHIQINKDEHKTIGVLDFDKDDADLYIKGQAWDEGTILLPNWIAINPGTGHGHAGYILEKGVSGVKPQKYFDDVLKKMAVASGADYGYKNYMTRNPLTHATEWLHDDKYTLADLLEPVKDIKLPKAFRPDGLEPAVGRNATTFEAVSKFAYSCWYKYKDNQSLFESLVEEKAHEVNFTHVQSLSASEVRAIVNSVLRFIEREFSERRFEEIQSIRGRRSGIARREAAKSKFNAIMEHKAAGFTLKEACEALELNYNSVRASMAKWEQEFTS